MAGKEAVIFIVDANLTMNAPYPSADSTSTRLSQAKDAAISSIVDLMWHSKTNEAGLVVLKAGVTHHHLSGIEKMETDAGIGKFFKRCGGGEKLDRYDDGGGDGDVFPNLVEFDLNRPTPSTLRAMKDVQCTINEKTASNIQGDLCDGLILASDALHRRTNGKKYKRKIVMITDAEHEVEVNGEQLQCVLDGLNKMEVELIIVGLGFQERAVIPVKNEMADEEVIALDDSDDDDLDKKPAAVPSGPDGGDDTDMMIKEEGNPDDIVMDDNMKQASDMDMGNIIKQENEKLLLSIAQETGGCILAANGANLTELLQTKLPCKAGMTKSVGKKPEFRIAPNLTVAAKSSKLTDKKGIPYTIKEAYQYDPETGKILRDGAGELMTAPTKNVTYHYDSDDNEVPPGE